MPATPSAGFLKESVLKKEHFTPDELKELFSYDPESGVIAWAVKRKQSNLNVGDAAGCIKPYGYVRIQVGRVMLSAHRVAWALHYGSWPTDEIDHINRVRSDNRISNLRACSHAENMRNKPVAKSNKTGFKGVTKHKGSYRATIGVNGSNLKLGSYPTPEAAHMAYVQAAKHHHGDFASY